MPPTAPGLPSIPAAAPTPVPVPKEFARLRDLAYNMWWSWNDSAKDLWQQVSTATWARSQNPLSLLQSVQEEHWAALRDSEGFREQYADVVAQFDDYMRDADTWTHQQRPDGLRGPIAYLSAEFGIHQTLPLYSGGLGVLAGDHLKAASDSGLPLVGVGLLYRRGYFRQAVDPDGHQQHHYTPFEVSRRPVRRAVDDHGHPITVQVDLPGRQVDIAVWRLDVGRVPLLLLDTDLPTNDAADRPITSILYVRGREMRFCQELVLGIGGVRALDALGIEPSVWHVNEGHSALSLLERVSRRVIHGESLDAAKKAVRSNTLFTLHTPVPAGNEVFDVDIAETYLENRLPGLDFATIRDLAASDSGGFDMGALAIRLSSSTNGVSRRHGEVATRDWHSVIGGPAQSVTNGVHLPTWVGRRMKRRFSSTLGPEWASLPADVWHRVDEIPNADLWEIHQSQKAALLQTLRTRLREQFARHGAAPGQLRKLDNALPDDRLTIVFARRFATYKRAWLLLSDPGRLQWLLTNPDRPIQIVFAGKAHPADREGQGLIQHVMSLAKSPELRGHIFFVEDYDIELARSLVGGADVWLNTPRPPMEASGTSGMKAAANGVLNVSVLDGWWVEAHDGANGWGFGEHFESDDADADTLYELIRDEVAPLYYDRDATGVPVAWVERMKHAIATVAQPFSARRMVQEYATRFYFPLSEN